MRTMRVSLYVIDVGPPKNSIRCEESGVAGSREGVLDIQEQSTNNLTTEKPASCCEVQILSQMGMAMGAYRFGTQLGIHKKPEGKISQKKEKKNRPKKGNGPQCGEKAMLSRWSISST